MLFIAANNEYDDDHFAYTGHPRIGTQFALVRDSHFGKCLCNYIVSELYCIMDWVTAASAEYIL